MQTLIKTAFFVLLSVSMLWGQSHNNVTFFTVNGEAFTLLLNGRKINKTPATTVSDTNVASGLYIKVVFEDTNLGEITDKFSLNARYYAFSYGIEADKKGVYKIKYISSDALREPKPEPAFTPPPPNNTNTPQVIVISGNGGTVGSCYVDDNEVQNIIGLIKKQRFADDMLETAKGIIRTKNQCLTSLQLKAIIASFPFESERLALAKYSYDYVKDRPNYYMIGEVFSFFKKQEFTLFLATK